jgi:hypothetical protein
MGASGWFYFVPHESSVTDAFKRLQRDVLSRGNYYSADKKKPHRSIEAALEAAGEDGTHSILDMRCVTDEPAPPRPSPQYRMQELLAALQSGATSYGTVYRMSEAEQQQCFGTTTPLRADVERALSSMMSLCTRGTGRWTNVFEAGKSAPVSLYFTGVSGD